MDFFAVILAGGSARRLGGAAKPALLVGGVPMIERVVEVVADARIRVVVGPDDLPVPAGVTITRERPPGGGPVAAVAAAFQVIPVTGQVAVLGGDLPLLTRDAIAKLRTALSAHSEADGAVYVDGDGRRQWLCGVWRTRALHDRLVELAAATAPAATATIASAGYDSLLAGASLRQLFGTLRIAEVAVRDEMPPWFDCDTEEDIRRVEDWLSR